MPVLDRRSTASAGFSVWRVLLVDQVHAACAAGRCVGDSFRRSSRRSSRDARGGRPRLIAGSGNTLFQSPKGWFGGYQQRATLVAGADQLEQDGGFALILADVGKVVEFC